MLTDVLMKEMKSATTTADLVQNTFVKTLVMANSIENLSCDSTDMPQLNKGIGKHWIEARLELRPQKLLGQFFFKILP